jgi:hypothetical protein
MRILSLLSLLIKFDIAAYPFLIIISSLPERKAVSLLDVRKNPSREPWGTPQ